LFDLGAYFRAQVNHLGLEKITPTKIKLAKQTRDYFQMRQSRKNIGGLLKAWFNPDTFFL
jgi:hypothetical protein